MSPSFRPPLDRLGFHRLSAVCLALQIGLLLLTVWAFRVTGLSYVWRDLMPLLLLPAWPSACGAILSGCRAERRRLGSSPKRS